MTVEVGWKIYSQTRHYAGTDPDIPEPVGGTVVEQLDYRELDPETGEIHARTVYRCLDWRHQWQHLDATEIGTIEGLDRNACWAGMRWLIRQISQKRRGRPTRDEIDAVRYAWTLLKASL